MPDATVRSPLVWVCIPVGTVNQVNVTDALPTKLVIPLYSSLVSTLPAAPPLAPLVTVKVSLLAFISGAPITRVRVAVEQLVALFTPSQMV